MSKATVRLQKVFGQCKEFKELSDNPIEGVHIEFEGDDVAKWDIQIKGPITTPYEGGVFVLYMDFSQGYPFKAPKIHFKTKIYHPNIKTETGEICVQAIENKWVPTQTAKYLIETLMSLMISPSADNPLEPEIADQLANRPGEFSESAKKFTAEHAK